MQPRRHLAISAGLGALAWWTTGRAAAGVVAMAVGTLPDLDHLVDYAYYHRHRRHRLILVLHGYEYVALGAALAAVTRSPLPLVAALSYLVHLLADLAENRMRIPAYSLWFRVWHRFRLDRLSRDPQAAARGRLADMQTLMCLLHIREGDH